MHRSQAARPAAAPPAGHKIAALVPVPPRDQGGAMPGALRYVTRRAPAAPHQPKFVAAARPPAAVL
ncbi:MAG TPA: hypothetical protein VFV41_13565 [Streptosporangiaceae bacterium]|nr:hypothetical protein [Streptosporangiaceae bacterium]